MNIYKLIKSRATIRWYKDKSIPRRFLKKIITAGIWGPSLLAPGFQPWKFVVVTKKDVIKEISIILADKAQSVGIGGRAILRTAALTVANSKCLIAVYNSQCLSGSITNLGKTYSRLASHAELAAISAAIQNMILVAESLSIGSCWMDAPLFCERRVNKLLNQNFKLAAFVTIGYSKQKKHRSIRRPISETVEYIV